MQGNSSRFLNMIRLKTGIEAPAGAYSYVPPAAGKLDSFSGAAATHLHDHNTEGVAWLHSADNVNSINLDGSGNLRGAAWGTEGYYSDSATDISQLTMTASVSTSLYVMVTVRSKANVGGYTFSMQANDGTNYTYAHIERDTGSTIEPGGAGNTLLNESACPANTAMNATHILKLTASGTNPVELRGYIDGTLTCSYSDSNAARLQDGYGGLAVYYNSGTASLVFASEWQDY
jgi:hypothetical protein